MANLQVLAEEKVNKIPELFEYADIILYPYWPEGDAHWTWVIAAPVEDIVDWAKEIAVIESNSDIEEEDDDGDDSWLLDEDEDDEDLWFDDEDEW